MKTDSINIDIGGAWLQWRA